jgi:integrase/recombinase XerD
MIALLAARPIRLANLSSIEIDRHLRRESDDFWLIFPAGEVKNRRPLEFALPAPLSGPMQRYLDDYRPQLLERRGHNWHGCPGQALWISEHGTALSRSHIRERICRRTRERFGHAINPHLFRDCAATSVAIEDPAHVSIIMPILGHSRADTAQRYYNQARNLDAARRFQDTVSAFRRD